jgi:hypothetical protein
MRLAMIQSPAALEKPPASTPLHTLQATRTPIWHCATSGRTCFRGLGKDFPYTPLKFLAIQHYPSPTAIADQTDVGTSARYRPFITATRMFFAQSHAHFNPYY